MSLAKDLVSKSWEWSDAEREIEDLVAYSPDLQASVARLALRFISKKGLSAEFAAVLQDIEAQDLLKEIQPDEGSPVP